MQNYFDCPNFRNFISLDCDRKQFIQSYLNNAGLEAPVIQLNGKNHIYVKFPMSQYNSMFKVKTIIAHYDRVPESPGANDNSAAVWGLLNWSAGMARFQGFHNVRIIFTDGEELGNEGINQQGAFALAQLFKKLGITRDDIYVFDCMGRGSVPIICQHSLPKSLPSGFLKKYQVLQNNMEKILRNSAGGKWFMLPTSYSDNASFISNGIPAIAITMLPSDEIDDFLRKKQIPETWKKFHTMEDDLESLTPEAFDIFINILNQVGMQKTLLDFT